MKRYDGKNAKWLIMIFVFYNLLPLWAIIGKESNLLPNVWTILLMIVYYGCNFIWIPIFVRNRVEII